MALIVFLRGVNVGGHRSFRPTTLATQLDHLDVVNIGATGTFVVRRPIGRRLLRDAIARRLPFEAEIAIVDGKAIAELVSARPFVGRRNRPDGVRFVSVLSDDPKRRPRLPVQLPARGRWLVTILGRRGRLVWGVYRREMRVIGYLGGMDQLFGVAVTTRGWGTIMAIAEVLDRGGGVHSSVLRDRPMS